MAVSVQSGRESDSNPGMSAQGSPPRQCQKREPHLVCLVRLALPAVAVRHVLQSDTLKGGKIYS